MTKETHFTFMISGTEDKRPNIITRNVLIILTVQEIPRVLHAMSQKPEMKTEHMRTVFWSPE